MATICPTVTAESIEEFNRQAEINASFAERVHYDFMDGKLAPTLSPTLDEATIPSGPLVDFHLMYRHPGDVLSYVIERHPHLVIIHADAHVDHGAFAASLHEAGIKAGLCLPKATSVAECTHLLPLFDHVLIFSGDLGHFGGTVDFSLLSKIGEIKTLKSDIEIGWDGGINADNAAELAANGVNVLNVGGFIQKNEQPQVAYATLKSLVQ